MYFAAARLLAYDGERWQQAAMPGEAFVSSLDIAENGRIWAGGEGDLGWFERQPDGQWKFHSLRPNLPEKDQPRGLIYQVFGQKDGAIFVSSDRVYRWNGTAFQVWTLPGVRKLNAFRIGLDIYVHYRAVGLFRLNSNGLELVIPQSLIGDNDTGVLFIDARQENWLIANGKGGLLLFKDGVTHPFAPEVSALLASASITSGARLPDGRYAFGTLRAGIVFMNSDGTLDGVLNEQNGLPASNISSLYLDREHGLWATSLTRILRINLDQSSEMFDSRARLAQRPYWLITRTGDRITVLNSLGILQLQDDRKTFSPVDVSSIGSINDLTPSPRGLVISGYRGAWRLVNGSVTQLYSSPQDVRTALPSRVRPGEIFLSRDPNPAIIAISPNGIVRTVVPDLPVAATSLAEDDDGDLWIATQSRGLFVAVDENSTRQLRPVSSALGLPSLHPPVVVRGLPSGGVVVVDGAGAWFKPSHVTRFTPVQDYPTRGVLAVSDGNSDDAIWLIQAASQNGAPTVAEISVRNGRPRWIPHSVVGLESVGIPRSIFAEHNTQGRTVLWIGGTTAVLRHTIGKEASAPAPRAPILRAFARQLSSEPLQPIVATLPYSVEGVSFEFAEPEFAIRQQLRLETRIDGIDSDWVPAGADSRRELTAVREGKYVFRVRAVAETGVASEPTVFAFEVAPPWWRTPQATIIAILVLIPLGYGVYRLRVRALRQRNVELEQKVQERTEELAEASAAKTLFVANMSHDIRNPLNGIVGLALALEETKLDTKQREIIATLRECTTYLSSLVDDVLDFASIEAGRIELRAGPFVPADLLNSIVTTLRGEASQRGAFVTIETDPDVPRMLRGDAGRIQQILVNYLGNALKYAGGHIRLSVGLAPNSPGEVEFAVADEGPGISSAEQKTLFSKFARLDGARKDQIPGTGLGLASCRLLADAMGGSVGIESRVGEGSRFFLRLPLSIATEPVRVPDDVSFPRTSVLLVEDTDYNAMAATAVLAKLGLTCDRARTGEEAIRMFGEKRHNVVLLDRNLPDLDGTEVARQMRELETDGLRSVLLAVTAYCTAEDRELCLKAGMDAFVGKPLTPDKLRRVLIDAGRRLLTTASIDASAEVHAAALDTSLLEYLADGTPGGLATQAERFITALSEAHAEVLAAHAAGELNALGDAAHRVLGHGRMVGATALTKAAIALESAARKGDAATATLCLPNLAAEIEKLTGALRRRPGVQKV
jgi:signal transduction histidine kinase/CheY-like chemotaxis protein